MQTYKYDELDKRGQDYVKQRYGDDQIVQELVNDLIDETSAESPDLTVGYIFDLLAWRFNEHGEWIV